MKHLIYALTLASAALPALASPVFAYDDYRDNRYERHDNYHERHDVYPDRRYGKHYAPAPVRYRYWHGRPYNYRPYYWEPVTVYTQPEYISTSNEVRCTDSYNPFGTIIGAGLGGLAGSTIGHGGGRTASIIGGAVLGGVIGNNVTRTRCTTQVFQNAPLGQPVSWQAGPQEAYAVVPVRDYQDDGRYCREYQSYATVGGHRSETYGTACMQPDGSWQIVN